MKDGIPEVIFTYAYPLDGDRRRLFARKELGEYSSREEIKQEIENWQDLWSELNKDNLV